MMKTGLAAFAVLAALCTATAARIDYSKQDMNDETRALAALEPFATHITASREIVNLGGTDAVWQVCFTKNVKGEKLGKAGRDDVFRWTVEEANDATDRWERVFLPYNDWDRLCRHHGFKSVMTFKRTVTLTEAQAGRAAKICFEGIGQQYWLWVNGREVAYVEQASTFLESADLTGLLRPGENEIRIRCADGFGSTHSWIEYPLNNVPNGIYGPLWLEFADRVHVSDVLPIVQVSPEKVMAVRVAVTNMTSVVYKGDVVAKVMAARGASGTPTGSGTPTELQGDGSLREPIVLGPGEGKTVELKKAWPEAHLWTPDDPKLYWMDVAVGGTTSVQQQGRGAAEGQQGRGAAEGQQGRGAAEGQQGRGAAEGQQGCGDAYRVRFGFRELTWKGANGRALMNGKPFIMRRISVAKGGWGWKTEDMRERIRFLKTRGLNGTRSFVPQSFSRLAAVADEEGFLITPAASVGWGMGMKTDDFFPRYDRYLAHMVNELKTHPSVVCWGISNESGTVYGGNGPDGKPNMRNAVRHGEAGQRLERLDPTRPWTAFGEIELRWHNNEGPMPIRSYHYPHAPCRTEFPLSARWFSTHKLGWQGAFTNDKPVSVSEDIYHGFQDTFPMTAVTTVGDGVYTTNGYAQSCWEVVRGYAEGYYLGGVSGWEPWAFYHGSKGNPIFEGPKGTPQPDYLVGIKELPRNFFAGEPAAYTLFACNERFLPVAAKLAVEIVADGERIDGWEKPMALDAGEVRELPLTLSVPPRKGRPVREVTLKCRLTAADKTLFADEFRLYAVSRKDVAAVVVPKDVAAIITSTNSPLRKLKFPKGVHLRAAEALATRPAGVVVHGSILPQDLQALDDYVAKGGRVLQLEPETGCCVEPLRDGYDRYTTTYRRDDGRMADLPEGAMRAWRDDVYVGAHPMRKPQTDTTVLWESVHRMDGMRYADVAWLWRGKGGWLVSTVRALGRVGKEPMAVPYLDSLFREFGSDLSVPPAKRVVYVDFGQSRTNGCLKLLTDGKMVFDVLDPKAASRCERQKTVFLVDAEGKRLPKTAQDFLKAVYARGGTAMLLDYAETNADDEGFTSYLGLRARAPLPVRYGTVSWAPGETGIVDQVEQWFVRKDNAGLMAGINNEELCWYRQDHRMNSLGWRLFTEINPPLVFKGKKPSPGPAWYAEAVGAGTKALTEPGAIFEKTDGKGRLVIATFSPDRKNYAANEPDKVYAVIKTLLNNLGAKTSVPAAQSSFEQVDLRPIANCCSWRKPGAEKLWIRSGDVDYRYFPVNRCGWSLVARNFCPVEEFPSTPLCYDGVYFKLIDPAGNGGRDVLFCRNAKEGECVIRLSAPTKVKRLHFLGFADGGKGYGVLFGGQKTPVKAVNGDHYARWANAYDSVKSGKKVYDGAWDCPPAERDPNLWKNPRAFVYHWFLENPEPDKPIDAITLTDACRLGLFAITIEK